ncbi:hypothetical protein D3C75_1156020 [compost metagenome]
MLTACWLEVSDGACAMPELPAATKIPPLCSKLPSKSSAPLPLLVGPLTITVPPDIVMEPFESSPSPEASTVSVPPLIVSILLAESLN